MPEAWEFPAATVLNARLGARPQLPPATTHTSRSFLFAFRFLASASTAGSRRWCVPTSLTHPKEGIGHPGRPGAGGWPWT